MKHPPEHYTKITEDHPLFENIPECCSSSHFIRRAVCDEMGFEEGEGKVPGVDEGFDIQSVWPLDTGWFSQLIEDAVHLLNQGDMPDLGNQDLMNMLSRVAKQLEDESHPLASLVRLLAIESTQSRLIDINLEQQTKKAAAGELH